MFKTGSPVKGDDFIDRTKHIPLFRTYLDNNQHIMVKAPRRFGKTSLVKHIFEYMGGYEYIYIDFKRQSDLEQIAHIIIDKAYKLLGIEGFVRSVLSTSRDALVGLLKSLQSIKMDGLGEITIRELSGNKNSVELFLHALDVVNEIAGKKGVNIKFVADEFQDIDIMSPKGTLDRFRSVIQQHEHVTYIFLGSIETLMSRIFEEKKSPFFHFAAPVQLLVFDSSEVFEYAKEVFDKQNITNVDLVQNILEFTKGHPDYTIQALQKLYFKTLAQKITALDDTLIKTVLSDVIDDNKAYIDELITQAKQKKHHLEILTDISNKRQSTIDTKSLYRIRSSLEDMGLIRKIGLGQYQINDVLLECTLRQIRMDGDVCSFIEE